MNISQEAIDHLLETATSYTGWLSNMRVLRTLPETGEVEIVTGETIDVGQAVEEVLLVALPHIRKQIADEIRVVTNGTTVWDDGYEDHQFCTSSDETGRRAFCSCGDAHYHWSAREESHEMHFAEMFEKALRTQIANEISDAAITLTSGSIAEVVRSVKRQAARVAEKGNPGAIVRHHDALESIDVEQLTTVILRTELPGGIKVGHADKIAQAVKNWLTGKDNQ